MKFWPLLAAVVAGIVGYVETKHEVRTLHRDLERMEEQHARDMSDYLGWNKSISERLRELERAN